MKIYIVSDTHFNHAKMHEVWKIRPPDFEAQIEKALQKLQSDDVLIHLGDICIGKDSEVHERYIKPLKCKKWLARGNHDKKTDGWYLSHGWDFVADQILLDVFGKKILFTHKPQPAGHYYDLNIHGHLHNGEHRDTEYQAVKHERQKLISLEKMGYDIFLLDSLLHEKS